MSQTSSCTTWKREDPGTTQTETMPLSRHLPIYVSLFASMARLGVASLALPVLVVFLDSPPALVSYLLSHFADDNLQPWIAPSGTSRPSPSTSLMRVSMPPRAHPTAKPSRWRSTVSTRRTVRMDVHLRVSCCWLIWLGWIFAIGSGSLFFVSMVKGMVTMSRDEARVAARHGLRW